MIAPNEDAWCPWSPHQLAERLRGFATPWYVVGGWALDLWLGEERRSHEDLEFAVAPEDAPRVARQLYDLAFFEAKDGALREANVAAPMADSAWQWWGADTGARCWRVDMMAERGTADQWRYKRDPSLLVPRANAIRTTSDGIGYLAPSLVLLFKAKHRRPKDQSDFDAVAGQLDDPDRRDLKRWLRDLHPEHNWIERLGD